MKHMSDHCSIDEAYIGDVQRILTILCFSIRPLTVNELINAHAEIVMVKDDNQQNLLIARISHFYAHEIDELRLGIELLGETAFL